ncbi:Mov34/MPN/PAD-1 family protein [Deinococcus ruber]|uniref:JAB domain-containing protein n=1 Tax=Deinococcus ruber TaxID=1848197 RepID=A0A918CL74_9DEIO|nr:Mov34/MPN/PAD-1 family protein [Deinococcus ruber]GGR30392.1 hypothetical protein GCM10008957_46490 [Deinococcus ruber]
MRILLPDDVAARLMAALEQAGRREVGGILMGEHVDEDVFRVVDLTVQMRGGTFASFWRLVEDFASPLRRFFERTHRDYRRFNYLGEWHSHHSFALEPSVRDCQTMQEIVEDPASNVNFTILLLVRVGAADQLEAKVTLHIPAAATSSAELVLESKTPPVLPAPQGG